ncbi:hypothetical protein AAHE18_16G192600 [Arachis hypogaea]
MKPRIIFFMIVLVLFTFVINTYGEEKPGCEDRFIIDGQCGKNGDIDCIVECVKRLGTRLITTGDCYCLDLPDNKRRCICAYDSCYYKGLFASPRHN